MRVSFITINGLIQVILVIASAILAAGTERLSRFGAGEPFHGPPAWFYQHWLVVSSLPLRWVLFAVGCMAARFTPREGQIVLILSLGLTAGFLLMTGLFLAVFTGVFFSPRPLQG